MGAEQIFLEILKQAPGIGATLFIVIKFLAHIDRIADRAEAADNKRNEVIEDNTAALGRNTHAMERTEAAIARLESLDRCQHGRGGGVPRRRPPEAGGSDPAAPVAK